jgi:hypothetical protein
VVQCQCRVMLAMVLPRQLGHSAMLVPSHAGNDAVEATWTRCDVSAESCWRWCGQGDLATVQCRCRVMLAMVSLRQLGRGTM